MIEIASWNVNSIRARLEQVTAWLKVLISELFVAAFQSYLSYQGSAKTCLFSACSSREKPNVWTA